MSWSDETTPAEPGAWLAEDLVVAERQLVSCGTVSNCPYSVPERTENLVIVVNLVGFPTALGAGDSAETRAIIEVAETA